MGCHGYLFENNGIMGTNWKIDGNICLKFSKLALRVVPLFSAWVFGQIREKTWSEFFQAVVIIQDGGETPILKKDLARIFSSQP
jgi:hypothetical protein